MQQLQTKGGKMKTNMAINKLNAVVQYNKFIKDLERADHYYSFLRKTAKWSKKWYCIC